MKTSEETKAKAIKAAQDMDWIQVVLNGGPPCFHIEEDGTFCGRADRWEGHEKEGFHKFVSLADLLTTVSRPTANQRGE